MTKEVTSNLMIGQDDNFTHEEIVLSPLFFFDLMLQPKLKATLRTLMFYTCLFHL